MSAIIEPAKTFQVRACLSKLKELGFDNEADWLFGVNILKFPADHWNHKQRWRAWHVVNRHKDKLTAAGLEVPPDPGIVSTHSRSESNFYKKGSTI